MKKIIAFLWACAVFATVASAQYQSQTVDLQFASRETKLIGPSPQAAAMARYADFPVSYCLGQAEVTIPLYVIRSRSLNIPVYLSYDTSGVKVDEVSGPVGLNWILHAGGVVTRTVAGLPDEYMNGYYCVRPSMSADPGSEDGQLTLTDHDYLSMASSGNADREWDLYTYSFAGRGGSFYLVHDPGSYQYRVVPTSATPLTIRYIGTGFAITDEDGTVWTFTEQETTGRTVSAVSPGLDAGGPNAESVAQDMTTVTAWYLSSVTSMDGRDTVTFTYSAMPLMNAVRDSYSRTYSFTYRYLSPGSYQWMAQNGTWTGPPVAVQNLEAVYRTALAWTPRAISAITYAGGRVEFGYVTNTISGVTTQRRSYPEVLASMKVYSDGSASPELTAIFSVLGNLTGDKRNLLKKVTIEGSGGTVTEEHTMTYVAESTSMNPKAKDLFGYYNGAAGNQTTSFLRLFENGYIPETPADRGYSPLHVSLLSLESVTTASGSRTVFSYEPNQVQTGGQSPLFSVIGIGHRIGKISVYDLSGASGGGPSSPVPVRERVFTYSGQGVTLPLSAFSLRSFATVNEVFRDDLAAFHPWWCGPTVPIARAATVTLSDQSVLPGEAPESARIFYSQVTERVTGPDGRSVRTDYVYDCSQSVSIPSGGSWQPTQAHDDHDDSPSNNVLGSHLFHFFLRTPYTVPGTTGPSGSVDFTPCMFHYIGRDRPEFGSPVSVKVYRTDGSGSESLARETVSTYTTVTEDFQTGLTVRHMISHGPSAKMRPGRRCAIDFYQNEVVRTLVWRRLVSTTESDVLDDGTVKSVRTDFTYAQESPGSSPSYPPVGSVISPVLSVVTFDGDQTRQYSRTVKYPHMMPSDSAWAHSLHQKGYRRPVAETVRAGGVSDPASTVSETRDTWAQYSPVSWSSGSQGVTFMKPSVTRVYRDGEEVGPTVRYTRYDMDGNPLEVLEDGQPARTYLW
jgi:hypothetical protein